MSAKLLLQYATSKLSEQEAVQILARSGLIFVVGTSRAHYSRTGSLINDKGQPISAPIGSVTSVTLANEAQLADLGKIQPAKAPEPEGRRVPDTFTPVGQQKAGTRLPDGQLHTQSEMGGSVTQTVVRDPRNPAITHTVPPGHAAYDEAAQKHAAITGGAIPNAHEVQGEPPHGDLGQAPKDQRPKQDNAPKQTVVHQPTGANQASGPAEDTNPLAPIQAQAPKAGQPGGPAATPGT